MTAARKRPATGALDNWRACNAFLKECTEDQAAALYKAEVAGRRRARFLLRIHARLNKLRGRRERAAIAEKMGR